ncbi:N-acetyl-gamma-glutamyl-phosphate reductase [Liberibacter crescens BT-1]|uniref:N-acetyl-gamma-glutamyl-phosphate reductase n=1 Tax=Liberibacter crescens (strain BT-1) TaxID=1215343 RepID=L0EWX0_LIBCB|nr:N-acetyl-gamma-glutamyl-phosphate reductase [Liberibacter crescens]AGA65148.1 N-acetyl-gamma-glutamyl-phosphate reductase [Liberibacter crescens BT-1]AMC13115.1 N-acetyl-gamma-glutamyl-phosphate reductase [Liberibacter crescens]
MNKVFIDGEHGTTGLEIYKRLSVKSDIELISLSKEDRHNKKLRLQCMGFADLAILCLPDSAAIDILESLPASSKTRIIDCSTAHRTNNNWVYGFAEMTKKQKDYIRNAQFVSNPGCYPTGALALIRPLRELGILPSDYPLTINAISGYTGGGKDLIAKMTDPTNPNYITENCFSYALNFKHKHIPEIKIHGLLDKTPNFIPTVARFPKGMLVHVPLHHRILKKGTTIDIIRDVYNDYYQNSDCIIVSSYDSTVQNDKIYAEHLVGTDNMGISVYGDESMGIIGLYATLDNLGKGASGAAIQNLNIMLSRE